METVIIPKTTRVTNGGTFLDYLGGHRVLSGWLDWAKALGHTHMGDLDTARSLLTPLAHTIRTRFPQLAAEGVWGHNLLELLRLIDEDPEAIPAHCEAVARKSVAVNKLEKFWEPVPFVYNNAK
jgi:hypothetical protein